MNQNLNRNHSHCEEAKDRRGNLAFARSLRFLWSLAMTVVLLSVGINAYAAEKIRVVTTTSTLASMVRDLLGEEAEIHYVASPNQNIHFIQPTPKDVLKVKKAKVLVHGGLDLEAWRGPLLDAAGNSLFLGDARNSIDVSKGIPLIEIPDSLSRIGGDIHAFGNPHYTTDPENTKIMMRNIADGLGKIFPDRKEEFSKKSAEWNQKLDQKLNEWTSRLAPFKGVSIVTYHKSWPYFANRFGFVIVGELEPKPGIPPTPKHLSELIQIMKTKQVRLIIKESYNEQHAAEKIARETQAAIVNLAQDVGEAKGEDTYIAMMDHNIRLIEEALRSEKSHD